MIRADVYPAPAGGASDLRLTGLETDRPARSRLVTLADDDTGTTAVLIGRLHYHADLARRFGPAPDPDAMTAAGWARSPPGPAGAGSGTSTWPPSSSTPPWPRPRPTTAPPSPRSGGCS